MRRVGALVIAFVTVATRAAAAAPPVHLHVADDSTCEGSRGLPGRLARRGITLAEPGSDGIDVDVRARPEAGGAEAELVIRSRTGTASRSLRAPTCDEVLDALVFTLGLALEQPIEDAPPVPPPVTPPVETVRPAPAAPGSPPPAPGAGLAWGGGAGAGVFTGASSSAAAAIVVHADVESRAEGILAPSAILGATFVLPSSTTTAGGADVASALQMGTADGCPVRFGSARFGLRPCVELQIGRLEARSAGFAGARLASSAWVALAGVLRGRAELGAGIGLELAVAGGSPLIQDAYTVGGARVLTVGPGLFSAIGGVGVHFP